jgi:NTP pyrophosphatase (non-canonical NTP hydrolase)
MSNDFSFTEYQLATEETAIYPEAGTGSVMALAYIGLGLGEAGEIQGKVKKILRDNGGVLENGVAYEISKELGDLLWYVSRMADELGLSLEQVARGNLEKLNSRKERGVLTGSGDNR